MKEKFENHPIIFGTTLLIAGFIAGYKVYPEINKPEINTVTATEIKTVTEHVGCKIEGIEVLAQNYHSRVSEMQKQLIKLEADAADKYNYAYRNGYTDAARRIRDDLAIENKSYKQVVESLEKKCSTET